MTVTPFHFGATGRSGCRSLLGLIVVGCVLYFYRGSLNQESIVAFSQRLPAFWVIVGFLILPLCGCRSAFCSFLAGFPLRFRLGDALGRFWAAFPYLAACFIATRILPPAVRDFFKNARATPSLRFRASTRPG